MAGCESQFQASSPSHFQHSHRRDPEPKHTCSLSSSTRTPNSPETKISPFCRLPTEIRLQIYKWALTVLHDDMGRPLIVVDDSSKFSPRSRFHNMSMCPSWSGEDGTARKLLAVNHQIHDEAEDFLYSRNTLFFQNSFDLDHLGEFLETLSNSARGHIRSVGFEVFFFVHAESGVPKRTFKQYEQAGKLLRARLPQWEIVLFYIDPFFYSLPHSVGGRDSAARGVVDLAARFRALCREVVFHPLP